MLVKLKDAVVADNTGLRKEQKVVVPLQIAERFLDLLKKKFGENLKPRVNNPKGFIGVTDTVYPRPFKFETENGEKKRFKIRFREYWDENLTTGQRVRSNYTKNKKFVELKFEHFDYESVIVKERLRLPDKMIKMLANPKQLAANLSVIETAALSDSENKGQPVGKILDFLLELQAGRENGRLDPDVRITYKRESYKIVMKDLKGNPVSVELTIDREIKLFDGLSKTPSYEYPDDVAITELKVPLKYGDLDAPTVRKVPGLKAVAQALALIRANRIPEFAEGKGKRSQFNHVKKSDDDK